MYAKENQAAAKQTFGFPGNNEQSVCVSRQLVLSIPCSFKEKYTVVKMAIGDLHSS